MRLVILIWSMMWFCSSSLHAQTHKMAFNGRAVVMLPLPDIRLDEPFTVFRVHAGKKQEVHRYVPMKDVQELQRRLSKVHPDYGIFSDTLALVLAELIWKELPAAKTLSDMPFSIEFTSAWFALGLAFVDENLPSNGPVTYEIRNRSDQLLQSELVELKLASFDELVFELIPQQRQLYGSKAELSWELISEEREQFQGFDVFREKKKSNEPAVLQNNWRQVQMDGEQIFCKSRDTTRLSAGIYAYYAVPFDRFGRRYPASRSIDWYVSDDNNMPLVAYFNAQAQDDKPFIDLEWRISRVEQVDAIVLERSPFADGSFVTVAFLHPLETTYTDEITEAMETYFYRILLKDRFGRNLPPSAVFPVVNTYSFTVLPPYLLSARPEPGGVTLEWLVEDKGSRGFYVFRKPAGAGEDWQQVSAYLPNYFMGDTISYVDTVGLQGHVFYEYAIRAESVSYVASGLSNIRSARPEIRVEPEPVFGLSVRKLEDDTFLFMWENVHEVDPYLMSYEFGVKKDSLSAPEWMDSLVIGTDENFVILEDIHPEAWYTVRAKNIFGYKGSPALPIQVPEHLSRLEGPAYLMGQILENHQAKIRWNRTQARGLVGYQLYALNDDGSSQLLETLSPDREEWVITPSLDGENRYYMQAIYTNGRSSEPSEVLLLVLDKQ